MSILPEDGGAREAWWSPGVEVHGVATICRDRKVESRLEPGL